MPHGSTEAGPRAAGAAGDGAGWYDQPEVAEMAALLDTLADRYRSMSEGRLRARTPSGPSRARAGLELARALALAAQGLEFVAAAPAPQAPASPAEAPPQGWRIMPEAGVFSVGDQLAVAAHDLLAALPAVAPDTLVPGPESEDAERTARRQRTARRLVADCLAAARELERLSR
ncbi:hypothetical protein [Allostreptomyces psammosilenae]|uniref:Uncharacterized protein n=1 Tax=Allostreptomyces psammosilenae TaxID=1892865 RepID=A0A853A5S5_9ACTN|nr:hypothetical protein [Allostreptomyces psammosilenae]NYI06041.1 hypothetical protein [Allostreptomyces psammosilenae]